MKDSCGRESKFGGKGRHYVFTFRDAVFGGVAEGYGLETIDENDDVVRLMARRLFRMSVR